MTQVFHSPLSLQAFSSRREWFGHCGSLFVRMRSVWDRQKYTDWVDYYRMFKFTVAQTDRLRNKLTQMTSWQEVELWLNENLNLLYANPATWLYNDKVQHKRIIRIALVGGTTEEVGQYFDFSEFEASYDIKGEAYSVTMKVWPEMGNPKRPGRFDMRQFKDAMACYGMPPLSGEDYQPAGSDEHGQHTSAHFEITFAFLKRDWPNLPPPPPMPGSHEWLEEQSDDNWEEREKESLWLAGALQDDPKDEVLQSHLKLITE